MKLAETEGTGIINYAETEGTGITGYAETEGTGVCNDVNKMTSLSRKIFLLLILTIFSASTFASTISLHTVNEGNLKGVWQTENSVKFVEGYLEEGKITLYVINSLFDKATDNGTGDKATDNGTGDKATDNGTGDKATDNGTGGKATDNGTGGKATDNGTGGKATDNGTGESILVISTQCQNEKIVLKSKIESLGELKTIEIEAVEINSQKLVCNK